MSLFLPLFIYAFTMGITPGPNNLIAMGIGVNYGFKRTLPFMIGVVIGFNTMLAAVAFGIGSIIATNDALMEVLSYLGTAFIVYMGYKIITAPTTINTENDTAPGFLHGASFQLINPKAWTACLGGIAAFNLAGNTVGSLMYIGISIAAVMTCVSVWGFAGSKIARFLHDEGNHKMFNYAMGGSLILLAIYLLTGNVGS